MKTIKNEDRQWIAMCMVARFLWYWAASVILAFVVKFLADIDIGMMKLSLLFLAFKLFIDFRISIKT